MVQETIINLRGIPVFDNHCRFFDLTAKPGNLYRLLSVPSKPMPDDQLRQTMIYRRLLKELRTFLGILGGEDEVMAERLARLANNYSGYIKTLLEDAGLHTFLVDTGYQPDSVSQAEFEELAGIRVRYSFRIETVLDKLWTNYSTGKITLSEVEERYFIALDHVLTDSRTVAIKSMIGCRTGLGIQPLENILLKDSGSNEKDFRDYFLSQSLIRAAAKNHPVQLHTAFCEAKFNYPENNPVLLKHLLESPAGQKAKIVIIHGGYPYTFEAANIAATHPNVFVDLSGMIPFVPQGLSAGLSTILDQCPFNKILYGSDGFLIPELHWLGAKSAKEVLASVLGNLVAQDVFDVDLALTTAHGILFDNAAALYGLEQDKDTRVR